MEVVNLPSLDSLVPGKFGILTVREEEQSIIPASEVDFVVVPGAAFSPEGTASASAAATTTATLRKRLHRLTVQH